MGGIEIGRRPTAELTHIYLQEKIGLDYWDRIIDQLLQLGYYSTREDVPLRNDPPIPHERSEALYLLEDDQGDRIIYVQFLPPDSSTSRHTHKPPVTEDYHVFYGELYLNGLQIPPEGFIVGSEIWHQATTRDQFSVTILRTNHVLDIPRDQIHIREAA